MCCNSGQICSKVNSLPEVLLLKGCTLEVVVLESRYQFGEAAHEWAVRAKSENMMNLG